MSCTWSTERSIASDTVFSPFSVGPWMSSRIPAFFDSTQRASLMKFAGSRKAPPRSVYTLKIAPVTIMFVITRRWRGK
jgi:hypothetical protein